MKSIPFVLERAEATRNAQSEIATAWVWPEKTVLQWDADIADLKARQLAELQARVALQSQNELWDSALDEIAANTRKVVRLAKTRHRNDPVKLQMFSGITVSTSSRDRIYNSGRELSEVWNSVDALWEPLTGLTAGGFGSALGNADGQKTFSQRKYTLWRRRAIELEVKALALDELNVAWYSDAITRFAEGTVEGDLIRSTVPTTTQSAEPVGQAVISHLMAVDGTIHFDCLADHATRFTYLHRLPGATEYEVLLADTDETSVTLEDQPPGEHSFKAFGSNSQGDGPESTPASVTVAAALAA
jgi:hypothetical protein